jgi:hypothetical protein
VPGSRPGRPTSSDDISVSPNSRWGPASGHRYLGRCTRRGRGRADCGTLFRQVVKAGTRKGCRLEIEILASSRPAHTKSLKIVHEAQDRPFHPVTRAARDSARRHGAREHHQNRPAKGPNALIPLTPASGRVLYRWRTGMRPTRPTDKRFLSALGRFQGASDLKGVGGSANRCYRADSVTRYHSTTGASLPRAQPPADVRDVARRVHYSIRERPLPIPPTRRKI